MFKRIRQAQCYNKVIFRFESISYISLLWISFGVFVCALFDTETADDIGIFYILLGIPIYSISKLFNINFLYYFLININSFS